MKRQNIGHTNGAKHHYLESTQGARRAVTARVWDPVEKRYLYPANTDAMLMRNAAIDEQNENPREPGPAKQRAIAQTAEPFNGAPRHERRKIDAAQRATARREAKQRGGRTDNPTAPLSEPVTDLERPCVYAKAVHAAKVARRRQRARTGHGGAGSRQRRRAARAAARDQFDPRMGATLAEAGPT